MNITPENLLVSIHNPIDIEVDEADVFDEFFEEFGVENKIDKIKESWE